MIEIELKYKLKKNYNIDFGEANKKKVEDIYYDTYDYQMLKNGNFLRVRNGKQIDFKLNANDLSHLYCEETSFKLNNDSLDGINRVFNNIVDDIKLDNVDEITKKLKVLAPIKKERWSKKISDNVIIVLDKVEELGDFLEIEYDLDKDSISKEEGEYYKTYLISVLKENLLFDYLEKEVHVGYVELYLKEYNEDAYNIGIYHE